MSDPKAVPSDGAYISTAQILEIVVRSDGAERQSLKAATMLDLVKKYNKKFGKSLDESGGCKARAAFIDGLTDGSVTDLGDILQDPRFSPENILLASKAKKFAQKNWLTLDGKTPGPPGVAP